MDLTQAIDRAKTLAGPAATQATPELWEAAAAKSLTIDQAGHPPKHPSYTPTYDPYWLAAEILDMLAIHTSATDQLLEFTSEGARFRFVGGDLARAAARLRQKSGIYQLARSDQWLTIDGHLTDYQPTSSRPLASGTRIPDHLDWS